MKPFRDYDLSAVIHNQLEAAHTKIDNMSNEEIMANNLEVLAENIYQEFFIEPITLFDEDFSKGVFNKGKYKSTLIRFLELNQIENMLKLMESSHLFHFHIQEKLICLNAVPQLFPLGLIQKSRCIAIE